MIRLSIFFANVTFLAATLSYGQSEFTAGVKGGVNISGVRVSQYPGSYSSVPGIHAGAYANFKYKKVAIQAELVYSQQGYGYSSSPAGLGYSGTNYENSLNYVNAPLMLKFYPGFFKSRLSIGLGLQYGVLLAAKGYRFNPGYGSASIGRSVSANQDVKALMSPTDVSVPVGVTYEFSRFNVAFRYNAGVTDIGHIDNYNGPAAGTGLGYSSAANRVFQLSVGYGIVHHSYQSKRSLKEIFQKPTYRSG